MLFHIISHSEIGNAILVWIEYAALLIEILAVAIIIVSIIVAFGRFLFRRVIRQTGDDYYHQLKISLGRALLLGLEVLVAADIVRTVGPGGDAGKCHRVGTAGVDSHLPELGSGG